MCRPGHSSTLRALAIALWSHSRASQALTAGGPFRRRDSFAGRWKHESLGVAFFAVAPGRSCESFGVLALGRSCESLDVEALGRMRGSFGVEACLE